MIEVDLLLIFVWIVTTLGIASFACYLGLRNGVEYPIAIMSCLVVIAAVAANKIVAVGNLYVPGGVIVASATFLVTDILSEIWGKEVSKRAVWSGFYGLLLMVATFWIVSAWPAPPFAQSTAERFEEILGLTPRIAIASIIAYLLSQHHDVFMFHFLKDKYNGKHLWLRNNVSTLLSQLIDSAVFITIAFYGILPIFSMIVSMWIVKAAIALIDTPFIYLVRWAARRNTLRTASALSAPPKLY